MAANQIEWITVLFGLLLLISAVLTIATSSIAIECYTQCGLNSTKPENYGFIITNLVFGIIGVLVSMIIISLGYYGTMGITRIRPSDKYISHA